MNFLRSRKRGEGVGGEEGGVACRGRAPTFELYRTETCTPPRLAPIDQTRNIYCTKMALDDKERNL